MKLETLRHSTAHVLAHAIKNLYPNTKFGIGPDIEDGFYYDFDFKKPISDKDLSQIEKEMKKIIKQDLVFKKKSITKAEAKKLFKDQPYKLELIKDLKSISIYQVGDFIDLCKGPHIKSTKQIPVFKLTKIAGAYWKGDEKNKMLTRIYGTAWENKKQLKDYFEKIDQAEKRDHRILGQKLELFMINEDIGAGLPIWLPKGATIRKIIEDYLHDELEQVGYKWLYTPHIASRKLWERSGHWNFYNESMYSPIEIGQSLEETQKGKKTKLKEECLLKPMNCPFHVYVYNSKIRSYRDLPIKLAELGTVYRYERSGTLHGLTRVRGFTQDDAHIICTPEQMNKELAKLVKHAIKMLKDFGFKNLNIYLSTRPEKYVGTPTNWRKATRALEEVLKKQKLDYKTDKGGGVFYGPKIDIKIKDSIGREWQCTTIQFDFNLPQRFKMAYIDNNGKKKEPYMIHRALLGSMERFFGVLIEHYAGAFPLWLSPVQIHVIPISDKHRKYASDIVDRLSDFRVELIDQNESLSKRIRNSETIKIPYVVVVGDQEIKSKKINIRSKGKTQDLSINKFIEQLNTQIKKKN